ncbi:MAG: putative MATE family efflux protein [Glaciecola sp.]
MLALAIPAIGTLVADPLLGAVDTAVAGRVGTVELGALGFAVAVLGAFTWIFNFLVYGTTASVARAIGGGDRRSAGARVAHAGIVALVLGTLGALLLGLGAPFIVQAFGAAQSLVDPAVEYLRIRAVGIPFVLLAFVGHGAFRGVQDTRTPLLVVVGANVLNGALDLVLVFVFDFGLAGIAWATVAAEVAAVVLLALLLRRAGLPLAGHGLPDRARVRSLVAVSRDLFLRTGGLVVGLLLVSAAGARAGADTAAGHQVLWQLWILLALLLDGFAIAAQAMIGTTLGARDHEAARADARALLIWGTGAGVLLALVLLPLRAPIVGLFTDDPAVLSVTAGGAWALAMGGQALGGVVFVLDGILMGASDFAYLRTWTLLAAVPAGIFAQVAVGAGGGLVWLWLAIDLMLVVRAVSLLARVRGTAWLTAGDALEGAQA